MEVARGVTKTSGSFFKGLEAGLSRLLVSPSFIFRLDSVEADPGKPGHVRLDRSEEHTSELQTLMRTSYAVFCLKKKNNYQNNQHRSYKRVIKKTENTDNPETS